MDSRYASIGSWCTWSLAHHTLWMDAHFGKAQGERPPAVGRVALPRSRSLGFSPLLLAFGFVLGLMVSGCMSPKHTYCMPPKRKQTRVEFHIAPPAPVPVKLIPLQEGFAKPLPGVGTLATYTPASSSSGNTAFVPPRADGQGIAAYGRGSKRLALQIAADPGQSSAAEDELRGRIFAKTSTAPLAMKLETWKDIAIAAGIADPFALDEDILYKVSAILWKSNYRSIDGYLSAVKQELTLLHGNLPQAFGIHLKRIQRAAARGRGPAKQSSSLPMERFAELEDIAEPCSELGPGFPRRFAILTSWWMLREIEAANLTLSCVSFTSSTVCLLLPSSKTDYTGIGTSRSLCCICNSSTPALCPFHNMHDQVQWATALAKDKDIARAKFPLFCTDTGSAISKVAVGGTILALAKLLGLPLTGDTGALRFSGHSIRVTGAMYLAYCGIDVWRIQLHGRWGSAAVLRYVRLAPLKSSLSLEASLGKDLRQVQSDIVAAKAQLVQVSLSATSTPALEDVTIPDALTSPAGALGAPELDHILACSGSKGWQRSPGKSEVLLQNKDRGALHSLKPPHPDRGLPLEDLLVELQQANARSWCGLFGVSSKKAQLTHQRYVLDAYAEEHLCKGCFGKHNTAAETSSSDSDSDD